jgi:CheY-like chemotaxis protein
MPRVLIADDEESMRRLVARAIAMDGHATVTAEDGAEALEILTREQGAFDLLLTDIQMPVMDGIALALAAARDFPDLKILLMTGFADQRERASGLNAIVHDVVTKPRHPSPVTPPPPGLASGEPDDRLQQGIQYAAASRFNDECLWNTGSPAFAFAGGDT